MTHPIRGCRAPKNDGRNMGKILKIPENSGLSLLELLIAIAILGMIVGGLYQTMAGALSSHAYTRNKRDLLSRANFCIERMAMFIREASEIAVPTDRVVEVPERLTDTHDNTTHAYLSDGDGLPDTDRDSDGFVDEGDGDNPARARSDFLYRGGHVAVDPRPQLAAGPVPGPDL